MVSVACGFKFKMVGLRLLKVPVHHFFEALDCSQYDANLPNRCGITGFFIRLVEEDQELAKQRAYRRVFISPSF